MMLVQIFGSPIALMRFAMRPRGFLTRFDTMWCRACSASDHDFVRLVVANRWKLFAERFEGRQHSEKGTRRGFDDQLVAVLTHDGVITGEGHRARLANSHGRDAKEGSLRTLTALHLKRRRPLPAARDRLLSGALPEDYS